MNKDQLIEEAKAIIKENTTNKVTAWGNNIRLQKIDNYIDQYYKNNNKFPNLEDIKNLKYLKNW
ncbi:MAG: hypothetical protein CMJ11_00760 [Pelagibacterales bacterium]|nr:hypothetical protein [Pelagibacterales bacterium]|tara:strand:- start:5526 stop:5717 length:192 start_codon:yes stop_codon:yes gene_type:complete